MKTISFEKTFPVSLSEGWELLCDVENYPRFVPFITEASLPGSLEVGAVWHDTTNILWVTQRIAHHVRTVDKHERLIFIVPVTSGEIIEEFLLEERGKHTSITMRVSISLRPRLVEATVGRILEKRFSHMLKTTLTNIEGFLAGK